MLCYLHPGRKEETGRGSIESTMGFRLREMKKAQPGSAVASIGKERVSEVANVVWILAGQSVYRL